MVFQIELLLRIRLGDFVRPVVPIARVAAAEAVHEDCGSLAGLATEDTMLLDESHESFLSTQWVAFGFWFSILWWFRDITVLIEPTLREVHDFGTERSASGGEVV